MFAELVQRKGAPVNEVNLSLQWRVFSRMTDVDQKLTALNLVGGFRTSAIKRKWDDDVQVKCSFCDEYDSRGHRLLSCYATQHVRTEHMKAVEILKDYEKDWCYLPMVSHHAECALFQTICKSIQFPQAERCEGLSPHHVYYTDGSCKYLALHEARLSTWAVVRDFAESTEHAEVMTSIALERGQLCPLLRCVDMGQTPGAQTISRAELSAIIVGCET